MKAYRLSWIDAEDLSPLGHSFFLSRNDAQATISLFSYHRLLPPFGEGAIMRHLGKDFRLDPVDVEAGGRLGSELYELTQSMRFLGTRGKVDVPRYDGDLELWLEADRLPVIDGKSLSVGYIRHTNWEPAPPRPATVIRLADHIKLHRAAL